MQVDLQAMDKQVDLEAVDLAQVALVVLLPQAVLQAATATVAQPEVVVAVDKAQQVLILPAPTEQA